MIDISLPWTKRAVAGPSPVALKLITCVCPLHGMEKPVLRVSDALALVAASPAHSVEQQRRVRREFRMAASFGSCGRAGRNLMCWNGENTVAPRTAPAEDPR